jgi:hypothetical protein
MSVRILFDIDALLQAGAVHEKTESLYDKVRLPNGLTANMSGASVFTDTGDKIELFEAPGYINDLGSAVIGYSYHDNICPGFTPGRRVGVYRWKTATGIVDNSNKSHYHIKLQGKRLEDIKSLHSLICQGKIWPVEDYQAEMAPSPLRNIRALLGELWEVIRRDVSMKLHRA